MGNKTNFRTYTLSLIAGQEYPLGVAGNMYAVISNTSDFEITIDDTNRLREQSAGMGGKFLGDYGTVNFLSAVNQSVTVVLGFGEFSDARASINATINSPVEPTNTLVAPGDVIVGVASTLLVAAGATTKEIELSLQSDATEPVRIGPAGVTATSGSILEPGGSKIYSTEAAVYAIRTGSVDETVAILIMGVV